MPVIVLNPTSVNIVPFIMKIDVTGVYMIYPCTITQKNMKHKVEQAQSNGQSCQVHFE